MHKLLVKNTEQSFLNADGNLATVNVIESKETQTTSILIYDQMDYTYCEKEIQRVLSDIEINDYLIKGFSMAASMSHPPSKYGEPIPEIVI